MKTFHLSEWFESTFQFVQNLPAWDSRGKMFEWKNEEPEVVEKGKMQWWLKFGNTCTHCQSVFPGRLS